MKPNYQTHPTITQSILGFSEFVRAHDFQVGIRETQEALSVGSLGLIADKELLRYSLKAIFCDSYENAEKFDDLFTEYWGLEKNSFTHRMNMQNQTNITKQSQRSLVMLGKGKSEGEADEEGKNVSGANSTEQLRKTDFSKVSIIDSEHLDKLAAELWKQMSQRLRKKFKKSKKQNKIDIRQTIRSNISNGGALLDLHYRDKKPTKNRLIILLDVSGSMDKYSFYLLRFILALRTHFKRIDAYIFSTKLIRITDYLETKDLQNVLNVLSMYADNWSSGTKIGECLAHFNRDFAKRSLTGKNMTIVLSDGLDTGEPELLAAELQKIKLRTKKLIWLNPLKGMTGYQPRTRGMLAALPEIDHFLPGHNVESLLQLENFLADA
jgi:uncharacterized protein